MCRFKVKYRHVGLHDDRRDMLRYVYGSNEEDAKSQIKKQCGHEIEFISVEEPPFDTTYSYEIRCDNGLLSQLDSTSVNGDLEFEGTAFPEFRGEAAAGLLKGSGFLTPMEAYRTAEEILEMAKEYYGYRFKLDKDRTEEEKKRWDTFDMAVWCDIYEESSYYRTKTLLPESSYW